MENPPTLLASSGWERSEQSNTLLPLLSLHRPYYCTTVLQYCRTTVKTVRPFDRRPNVYSISREVWGIVSPANSFSLILQLGPTVNGPLSSFYSFGPNCKWHIGLNLQLRPIVNGPMSCICKWHKKQNLTKTQKNIYFFILVLV